jgi:outer membrane lipoprotein carrier protein
VIRFSLLVCLLALPAFTSAPDVSRILKGVEERYNRARTLQAAFVETYTFQGRARKPESGTLSLRKPGRMRWDYAEPPGKLFLSDGKNVYLYVPRLNRVERMKLKESDDMRAPLAFLLGKLNFKREFSRFAARPEGSDVWITAFPKSDRLPYKQVDFLIAPDYSIRRLVITGQDNSGLVFHLSNEKVNPQLADSIFRFQMPPNAELVESMDREGE